MENEIEEVADTSPASTEIKKETSETNGTHSDQSVDSEDVKPIIRLVAIEKLLDKNIKKQNNTERLLRKKVIRANRRAESNLKPTATIVLDDSDDDFVPEKLGKITTAPRPQPPRRVRAAKQRVCKIILEKMNYSKIMRRENLSEICDENGETIVISKRKARAPQKGTQPPSSGEPTGHTSRLRSMLNGDTNGAKQKHKNRKLSSSSSCGSVKKNGVEEDEPKIRQTDARLDAVSKDSCSSQNHKNKKSNARISKTLKKPSKSIVCISSSDEDDKKSEKSENSSKKSTKITKDQKLSFDEIANTSQNSRSNSKEATEEIRDSTESQTVASDKESSKDDDKKLEKSTSSSIRFRSMRKKAKPRLVLTDSSDQDNAKSVKSYLSDTTDNEDENQGNYSRDDTFNAKHEEGDSESKEDSNSEEETTRHRRTRRNKGSSSSDKNSSDEEQENSTGHGSKKRRRVKKPKDSESSDEDGNSKTPLKGRKKIRKLLDEEDLDDVTKRATREEAERKKRIEERQRLYDEMYTKETEKVTELEKLVLDFDEETKEELLSIDKKLVKKLKPHQASGIKFMWNVCFETLDALKTNEGSGCILAHCMGLGKTLQVIALAHTLLASSRKTQVERVLVICPLSTVHNWMNEFKMWLRQCAKNRDVGLYDISKLKKVQERVSVLQEWHDEGGVLILGYDMFRNLTSGTGARMRKKMRDQLQSSLVDPGADFVVCDEGHLLKNEKTSLSKAVNRIKTKRRVVLTGTPLQNNLKEYYCMVQFVKPNLLGSYNEYMNRFVNPITNGQYTDSTDRDIQLMKKRAHVLHKMLDGSVQRRDYAVLAPFLPPKNEYVLFLQLSELQIKLYEYYMVHKPNQQDPNVSKRSSILFADFQNLSRIWTHPRVMRYSSDKYELNQQKKRDKEESGEESEGSIKDFLNDTATDTPSDSSASSEVSIANKPKKKIVRKTRRNAAQYSDSDDEVLMPPKKEENPSEWWMQMVAESELDNIEHSTKLMMLFSILEECEAVGDKLLVFSQSLYSLDVIEHFLSLIDDNTQNPSDSATLGGFTGSWSRGVDYFRLDGSTNVESRGLACNHFNDISNPRARLFLISTRAGGLGINLVAANRVIIFDVSWNPSHDIQSIFRVYRFGQKKPCYIYRFIAMGTMEEKVYERQVVKQSISKRVIDEQQIDRHYKETDLAELYVYDLQPKEGRPVPKLPKDRLFAELLCKYERHIYRYHEHDSLLENKEEETLNEEERKAAWEEYEAEKSRPQMTYPTQRAYNTQPVTSNVMYGIRTDILLKCLNLRARQEFPNLNDAEINVYVPRLLQRLSEELTSGVLTLYQDIKAIELNLERSDFAYSQLMQMGFNQQPGTAAGFSGGLAQWPMSMGMNVHQNQLQQHQQMIQQAQNRHMRTNNVTEIVEID